MGHFTKYIGIDYSGAGTSSSALDGLRVFEAFSDDPPREVHPRSGYSHWSRVGLADWLVEQGQTTSGLFIGIDHGFSFPAAYFTAHGLPPCWRTFLRDFLKHWPTHLPARSVQELRGPDQNRIGKSTWRRRTEIACRAKSVFHFDVPGSVAKSTHAGLPWLTYVLEKCPKKFHVWPFDGWELPGDQSVIVEAYPALFTGRCHPPIQLNSHQKDAWMIAECFRDLDQSGELKKILTTPVDLELQTAGRYEGWIAGVPFSQSTGTPSSTCSKKSVAAKRSAAPPGERLRSTKRV